MSKPNASFEKLLEYEQRAVSFTPGQSDSQASKGEWAGVAFRIGETRLTCSINQVHEFIPPPPITRVPGTKTWILGMANVRGDLVTIIDLACFLGGERSPVSARTRLLSATLRGRPVGLMVDEVFGQKNFSPEDAGKPALSEQENLEIYVNRAFNSGSESWPELDLDLLFNTPEFLNGAAN